MTNTIDDVEAREIVSAALLTIVPDAQPAIVDVHASLREEFELDSLDFLAFVSQLSRRTGRRIDEEDYGRLRTLAECIRYVRERAVHDDR